MPLQNRVDPYGQLYAVDARGAWMGNRGVLHNSAGEIVAQWRSRRWITCVLRFKGIRRKVFAPHRYSELFFLDEATSLAAGHRPCAECRRNRFQEFSIAWSAGRRGSASPQPARADEIDRVVHADRVHRRGIKKTYEAVLSSLPPGAMIDREGRPFLYWGGELRPWSFSGYGPAVGVPPRTKVRVLTPKSIVNAIQSGLVPQVHESAGG
ncbi:MAG TPA: hypothetical protein VF376_01715 [Thermoanaerobaculia bacterium]